jgi:hypothetical protein
MPNYLHYIVRKIETELKACKQRIIVLEEARRTLTALGYSADEAVVLHKAVQKKRRQGITSQMPKVRSLIDEFLHRQPQPIRSREILEHVIPQVTCSDSTVWKALKDMRDEGHIKWDTETHPHGWPYAACNRNCCGHQCINCQQHRWRNHQMAQTHNIVPINARLGHEDDNTIAPPKQSEVTIKTNRRWRNFVYSNDVPVDILVTQFNHLDLDVHFDQFFRYRGWWYHVTDFMGFGDPHSPLAALGWDGYHADSYFSGVVIRFHRNDEQYMIGTFYA